MLQILQAVLCWQAADTLRSERREMVMVMRSKG